MHVATLGLMVALAAEPCAALSGGRRPSRGVAKPAVLRSRRPTLRALRGGATGESGLPFWVRNGTEGSVQLVHDLGAFCEEHELDEDAMLAVSRGEADEHDGYTCGVPSAYDAPPAASNARAAVEAKEVPADEVEEADDASEVSEDEEEVTAAAPAAKPPAPNMQKMMVGMIAPMGVLQVRHSPYRPPSLSDASRQPIRRRVMAQLRARSRHVRRSSSASTRTLPPSSLVCAAPSSL